MWKKKQKKKKEKKTKNSNSQQHVLTTNVMKHTNVETHLNVN